MANELSKKESHRHLKRFGVIAISFLIIVVASYLISSAIMLVGNLYEDGQ